MPIPETPYTREEAYLNAIATGDSGGIPETPYTREEMYLDYIARNGGGGGGGSSTLSGLTDVDISNPTDGQTLVYNAASGKWENGAGGGGVIMAQIDGQTGAMSMTWQELHDAMLGGNLVYAVKHYTETDYDAAALFLLYEVVIEAGHYIVSLIDPGESRKEIGEASGGANDYPVFSF